MALKDMFRKLLTAVDGARDELAAKHGVQPASRHYGGRKSLAAILVDQAEFERTGASDKKVN